LRMCSCKGDSFQSNWERYLSHAYDREMEYKAVVVHRPLYYRNKWDLRSTWLALSAVCVCCHMVCKIFLTDGLKNISHAEKTGKSLVLLGPHTNVIDL
jgi:hypothetical protein